MANIPPGNLAIYDGSGNVITNVGGSNRTYLPETCTDHLTPGWPRFQTDHPLFIKKVTTLPPRLSGEFKMMMGSAILQRLVYDDFAFQYSWLPAETLGPDLGYYYTEALAKVNPNVPIVDIPAEVLDTLGDLPSFTLGIAAYLSALRSRLYRDRFVGSNWIRRRTDLTEPIAVSVPAAVAGSYVTWSFVFAPVLGLIEDLMTLDESIAKRESQLKKYVSKGLKMTLENTNVTSRSTVNLSGDGMSHPFARTFTTTTKVWLEAKFFSFDDPMPSPGLTVADRAALKRAIAMGRVGNVSFDTIWEAIPFSWLIDYFANISSYLKALRGYATYTVLGTNIMRTTTFKTVVDYVGPSPYDPFAWKREQVNYTAGSHSVIVKERTQGGIPNWYLRKQWLTPHQTGILASIGAAMAVARR